MVFVSFLLSGLLCIMVVCSFFGLKLLIEMNLKLVLCICLSRVVLFLVMVVVFIVLSSWLL